MTYVSTVLADAPVNYWRLADGVSHILHDIGSAPHHLALTSQTPLAGGYSGIEAGGGSFYASDLADTQGDGVTSSASRSCELWSYQVDTKGGTEMALYLHGSGTSNGNFNLYILASGSAFFRAAAVGATDPAVLAPQQWHHLVGTYDGANAKLYTDGALVATAASAGGSSVANAVYVGHLPAGLEPFHGFLSEIAEYNYALTAAQVGAHFAAATPPASPVSGFLASYAYPSGSGIPAGGHDPMLDQILAAVKHTFP